MKLRSKFGLGATALLALPLALAACSSSNEFRTDSGSGDAVAQLRDTALAKGRMMFGRGEYALAIDEFRQVIRYAPESALGFNGLAASYDMLGRFDISRNYYDLALAQHPNDPLLYRNLARSLKLQGKQAEATQVLAKLETLQSGRMFEQEAVNVELASGPAVEDTAPPLPYDAEHAVVPPLTEAPPPVADKMSLTPAIAVETNGNAHLVKTETGVVELRTATLLLTGRTAGPMPKVESRISKTRSAVAIGEPLPWYVEPTQPLSAQTTASRRKLVSVPFGPLRSVTGGVSSKSYNVALLNAAGSAGLARRAQQFLTLKGFHETRTGNAKKRLATSWIIYPEGEKKRAYAVRGKLPFATTMHVEPGFQRVVVLLGEDVRSFGLLTRQRLK